MRKSGKSKLLIILAAMVLSACGGSTSNAIGTTSTNAGTSQRTMAITVVAAPVAFNKISPANGTINLPPNPTLSWGASSNAQYYQYCLNTTGCTATSRWISTGTDTSVAVKNLLSGTYYWQVRARNTLGTTYANGGTPLWKMTFTVLGAPGPFIKVSPANGVTVQPTNPTFRWGDSANAEFYQYCLNKTGCTASSKWISTGANTRVDVSGLTTGTYYWQVRARNTLGATYANAGTPLWTETFNVP
jgi:hypothetical protein